VKECSTVEKIPVAFIKSIEVLTPPKLSKWQSKCREGPIKIILT
jgi:hypothetical protein